MVEFRVNGVARRIETAADRPLLSVLREELDLTGAKYGCGEGQCGACTVLLDGKPVRSCMTPISAAASKSIITIEGLEENGALHPLQQAFLDAGAFECGYCTCGMILSGVALLRSNRNPSESEITQALDRNICRCGTYPRIVQAVSQAAEILRKEGQA